MPRPPLTTQRNANPLCRRVPRGTGLSTRLTHPTSEEDTFNPAATHKTIFGSNGSPHPRGGKVALTVEEGMIRNIANRVTSDGIGAFDVELGDFQAVGQIIDQVYKGSPTSPSLEPPERPSRR